MLHNIQSDFAVVRFFPSVGMRQLLPDVIDTSIKRDALRNDIHSNLAEKSADRHIQMI
jgi:hypothetical protein